MLLLPGPVLSVYMIFLQWGQNSHNIKFTILTILFYFYYLFIYFGCTVRLAGS